MSKCIRCGDDKPLGDFYSCKRGTDQRDSTCKACRLLIAAARRADDPLKLSIRDRVRYETNPKRKEECHRHALAQAHRHPFHKQARSLVSSAIKCGRMVRKPCEVCGSKKSEAHHEDYSKPLEVNWLCRTHHMERHRKYFPPERAA